jgi:hypothetical protein
VIRCEGWGSISVLIGYEISVECETEFPRSCALEFGPAGTVCASADVASRIATDSATNL